MKGFRVGVDSYCLNPSKLSAFEVLEWVAARGGEGVQFSEGALAGGGIADDGFLHDLAGAARERNLYLEWGGGEHVPFDTATWREKDLIGGNRRAAESASMLGARVVRSCSGGFFRWGNDAPEPDVLLEAMAAALRPQRSMFEELGVTLSIEIHFEFTTFELLRLFDMCDAQPGGWLGVVLDTFNMLPMLEDPALGTERILPWIEATHIKDGTVALNPSGLTTFPTELGRGQVDLSAILDHLDSVDRPINLSVEGHGGSFETAIFDDEFMERFPDVTAAEMERLLRLGREGRERLDAGIVAPTDRAGWPELCERRTDADLSYLREFVANRASGSD